MNDSYLYRAKCCNKNEYVTGYLYITHAGKYEISCYNENLNTERFTYTVIPESVGRCTGMRDMHGDLIFQNQIIKAFKHDETPYTNSVTFHDGCFWFGSWNWIEFLSIFRNIEIVGDKAENMLSKE